jgi:hypothetical protein
MALKRFNRDAMVGVFLRAGIDTRWLQEEAFCRRSWWLLLGGLANSKISMLQLAKRRQVTQNFKNNFRLNLRLILQQFG